MKMLPSLAKKDFAAVIKDTDLEMRLDWINPVGSA
jgi:hypothetical protein